MKSMLKKILTGALAALLCAAPALAEVYVGTTVAGHNLSAAAACGAQVEAVYAQTGSKVAEGDVLATLRTTKVFASQSGVIARIQAVEGQEISGTALELQPVSRYDIYCTVEKAYASSATMLVHSGESLYLRCTANGTHQGTATVTSIEGETYMAAATGGEFYNGETVYLYRDPEFSYSSLVGVGTVVAAATEIYETEGRITKLHVEEGEYVERGELLYEMIDGDSAKIIAPADGVVITCDIQAGDSVEEGQIAATIVPQEDIQIEIQVDEAMAASLQIGDDVAMTYACDAGESLVPGEILEISRLGDDGLFRVYISPEYPPEYLGMTVNVRIG